MSSVKTQFVVAILVVTLYAIQLAKTDVYSTMTKLFDNRIPRCPASGDELEFDGRITVHTLLFPIVPCRMFCIGRGRESYEGREQKAIGPTLYCCCSKAKKAVNPPVPEKV